MAFQSRWRSLGLECHHVRFEGIHVVRYHCPGYWQLSQRDARNLTAREIADPVDVSDGAIRNPIDDFEERGLPGGTTGNTRTPVTS